MSTADIDVDELFARCNQLAEDRGEWAGSPAIVPGLRLVLEPRYPWRLDEVYWPNGEEKDPVQGPEPYEVVGHFHCARRYADVYLVREAGKIGAAVVPDRTAANVLSKAIDCLSVANLAWSIEAETEAMERLQGLVSPVAFKQYFLTGSFVLSSQRSGVMYLFRRLRPTVAMSGASGNMRILCCLCLHPIGYYEGTAAGAMCPTDDVISHVLMMRGDERKYWSKANQIPAWRSNAGVY